LEPLYGDARSAKSFEVLTLVFSTDRSPIDWLQSVLKITRFENVFLAGGMDAGSQFRRAVGGPLVGGVDIMMYSDPRTVVLLACSPLLHYAFCVAKLRGCHDHDRNPYRAVRQYGTYARTPRARADGSHMHDRESCIRASARRPRARADGNSERGHLRRIRAGNANLLLA
jgi:hypothetical protein